MPYNQFSVLKRGHKLPQTDYRVITECRITHYNKCYSFFLHCKTLVYDKFRTQFLTKFAISTLTFHY